jgi:hypothetical protein
MCFLDLKQTSTDIAADSTFEKFRWIQKTLCSCTFGTAANKYSNIGPSFLNLRAKKGWNFDLKINVFQAKIGFCNFYVNISEYLKPDSKTLNSGLFESVEKCTKN